MFKRAHPSYYAAPIVFAAGYAIYFNSLSLYAKLFLGAMLVFFTLVAISLIIWPQDR